MARPVTEVHELSAKTWTLALKVDAFLRDFHERWFTIKEIMTELNLGVNDQAYLSVISKYTVSHGVWQVRHRDALWKPKEYTATGLTLDDAEAQDLGETPAPVGAPVPEVAPKVAPASRVAVFAEKPVVSVNFHCPPKLKDAMFQAVTKLGLWKDPSEFTREAIRRYLLELNVLDLGGETS